MSKLFLTLLLSVSCLFAQGVKFQRAESCGKCHKEIYQQWKNSKHAFSTPEKNPLFAKIYEKSQKDTDGETKLYCIRCHAPVTMINGDFDLKEKITNEGVTCDVCHTLVELSDNPKNWPNIYKPGKIKRGVFRDSKSSVHKNSYSKLLATSAICSGCHGDMLDIPGTRSCGNLTICDTDFEWKSTSFAGKGEDCKSCHMKAYKGKTAKGGPIRERIFRHDFPGAYSPEMLKKSVKLNLEAKEFEGEMVLSLGVKNQGAAHLVPTGPPARMAFIKVSAFNKKGEITWSNFKKNPVAEDPYGVFHIVFADVTGKKPSMPWLASKIVKDTRLRPGELRKLVYKFSAKDVEQVEAKLFYRLF